MIPRTFALKAAFAALAAAAALLLSGRLSSPAYAGTGGCTVTCADGSTCGVDAGAGQKCTCTCALWGHGSAQCTCAQLKENTPG